MGELDQLEMLKTAIQKGDLSEAKKLILNLKDTLSRDAKAEAFLETIKANQIKIFEYFVEEVDGLNLRYSDAKGRRAIHYAAEIGNIDMVKVLLRYGSAASYSDNEGYQAVHIATKNGDTDMLTFLLKQGANPFGARTLKDGYTPLHIAALSNQPQALKILADNVTSLNPQLKRQSDALTPLHLAVKSGHEEIVKILCERGACLDLADMEGRIPLHFAAEIGNIDMVKVLFRYGSAASYSDNEGYQAVHIATKNGDTDMLTFLLKQGANPFGARTLKDGYTPLHIAALSNQPQALKILADNVTSLNPQLKRQSDALTPLHLAVKSGHEEIVKILCERGACLDLADMEGRIPLHFAADKGRYEIMKTLLQHGSSLNIKDTCGRQVLHYAVFSKSAACVQLLIDKGAKMDVADISGHTPLVGTVIVGLPNIIDILLKNGANVNVLEGSKPTRETPLLLAASADNVDVIRILLDAGANVLVYNRYRETVLHKCQKIPYDKRDEVVLLLIKAGAELNTIDKNGFTPLHKLTFQSTVNNFSMSTLKILVEYGVHLTPTRSSAMSGGSIVGESRHSPLCWLVWRGFFEAAAYLVNSGWNLYPETWMYLPGNSPEQNSFHQWMIDVCRTTPSLMQLCRTVIRRHMIKCTAGQEIMTSLSELELPRTLTEFLMLKN